MICLGVTRDRLYRETEWNGAEFRCSRYTGGLNPANNDFMMTKIKEQARSVFMNERDVILLLVVDGKRVESILWMKKLLTF